MYSLQIEVKQIKLISNDFPDNTWIFVVQFIQITHFTHSWQLNVINHGSFIWVKFKVNVDMLILVTVQFCIEYFFQFLRFILIESLQSRFIIYFIWI